MKRRLIRGARSVVEVGVSPLVDMVFILLVFFIVTTIFVDEKGLETRTEEAVLPQIESDSEPIVFSISESGAVYYRGDEIRRDQVPSIIGSALGETAAVRLEFPPETKTKFVTSVMGIARGTKAKTVTLKPIPGG